MTAVRYNGYMVGTLAPTAAADLMSNPEVEIVDVRDDREWVTGHIPGARLVPLERLREDPDAVLHQGGTIIFVCSKGVRSLSAAKLAERLGYANVYSLDGGTSAWAKAGLPLVSEHAAAA
jgi:rhodanese-related sulfurtransferase